MTYNINRRQFLGGAAALAFGVPSLLKAQDSGLEFQLASGVIPNQGTVNTYMLLTDKWNLNLAPGQQNGYLLAEDTLKAPVPPAGAILLGSYPLNVPQNALVQKDKMNLQFPQFVPLDLRVYNSVQHDPTLQGVGGTEIIDCTTPDVFSRLPSDVLVLLLDYGQNGSSLVAKKMIDPDVNMSYQFDFAAQPGQAIYTPRHLALLVAREIDLVNLADDNAGLKVINMPDFAEYAKQHGKKGPNLTADFNADGIVNLDDLLMLTRNWMKQVPK